MSYFKASFAFCLLLFCIFSCKNQPKPLLTANFFLRYTFEGGDFKSEAKFRNADGKAQALNAAPTVNGVALRQVEAPDTIYVLSENGKFSPEYKFAWQDISGDTTSFTVQLDAIPDFSFSEEKLDRNKTARLSWQGKPLKQGESLVLLWQKERETVTMQHDGLTANSQIDIEANKLQALSTGQWTLYLVRKQRIVRENHPFKAAAAFEFYTKTKAFEVY